MKKQVQIISFILTLVVLFPLALLSQRHGVSTTVPEEGGISFMKISDESNEQIAAPEVKMGKISTWWGNSMLALSPDNQNIAYLSSKNGQQNIMIRNTGKTGASIQRTFKNRITDFSWSSDGKLICFSEGSSRQLIYTMNAMQGSVLQQISSGISDDYAPSFSPDGSKIFFARYDGHYDGYSIWSYDQNTALCTNYSIGKQPFAIDEYSFLCVRTNTAGVDEIWLVNYETGSESLILSSVEGKSFSTPSLSPDKKWILCVGTSLSANRKKPNLDLYVVKIDGTGLTQLTYHPGHDASPVWSKDGKDIYFLSQRGTEKGKWNIWKMTFPMIK